MISVSRIMVKVFLIPVLLFTLLCGHAVAEPRPNGRKPRQIENFLVNLATDPGEKTNLAEKHPDILTRLRGLHEEHLR